MQDQEEPSEEATNTTSDNMENEWDPQYLIEKETLMDKLTTDWHIFMDIMEHCGISQKSPRSQNPSSQQSPEAQTQLSPDLSSQLSPDPSSQLSQDPSSQPTPDPFCPLPLPPPPKNNSFPIQFPLFPKNIFILNQFQSLPQNLISKLPKKKKFSKRTKIAAVGITILLILVSIFAIISYAHSLFDQTEMDVEEIRILSSDEDSLSLEVDISINNPSPREIRLESTELILTHEEETAGYVDLSSMKLKSGENRLTLAMELREDEGEGLEQLVSEFLSDEDISVNLKGDITTKGYFPLTFDLDKEMVIEDSGGFNVDVRNITIPKTDESGIHVRVETVISNPTILETTLEGLKFDLIYDETIVSTLSTTGYLYGGDNPINFEILLAASASDSYNSLISNIMNGENSSFQIRGNDTNGRLLSRLAEQYSYEYDLDNSGDFNATVNGISIVSLGLFSSTVQITAQVTNPSRITANISDFEFTAFRNHDRFGDLDLLETTIVPGSQGLTVYLTIGTLSILGIGDIVLGLVLGSGVELVIEGKREFDKDHALKFYVPIIL